MAVADALHLAAMVRNQRAGAGGGGGDTPNVQVQSAAPVGSCVPSTGPAVAMAVAARKTGGRKATSAALPTGDGMPNQQLLAQQTVPGQFLPWQQQMGQQMFACGGGSCATAATSDGMGGGGNDGGMMRMAQGGMGTDQPQQSNMLNGMMIMSAGQMQQAMQGAGSANGAQPAQQQQMMQPGQVMPMNPMQPGQMQPAMMQV